MSHIYKLEQRTNDAADALARGEFVNLDAVPDMHYLNEVLLGRGLEDSYFVENDESVNGGRIQLYKFSEEQEVSQTASQDVNNVEQVSVIHTEPDFTPCEVDTSPWSVDYEAAKAKVTELENLSDEIDDLSGSFRLFDAPEDFVPLGWGGASLEMLRARELTRQDFEEKYQESVEEGDLGFSDVRSYLVDQMVLERGVVGALSGNASVPDVDVFVRLKPEQQEYYIENLIKNNQETVNLGFSDQQAMKTEMDKLGQFVQTRRPPSGNSSEDDEALLASDSELKEVIENSEDLISRFSDYGSAKFLINEIKELDPKAFEKYYDPDLEVEPEVDVEGSNCLSDALRVGVNGGPAHYEVSKTPDIRLEGTDVMQNVLRGGESGIVVSVFNNNTNTEGSMIDARSSVASEVVLSAGNSSVYKASMV